ncbi:acyltransferase [Pseudomonas chlororaphis]|uniref:acyltransferase n=1 Tax=Pseudomonas chlororaphis TaxID=587753 RepID=UPI0023686134|nr:acyltransferase family protein [Pseudomonas chlororaphis]WDH37432.1 acyltransferase family protein [Pseudomonas chlororaphis]WDH43519.1 acyltransferase family protein [Pseudomonas chlororaphis]
MKNDQYLWVHYVKAVAIAMVVVLHVAAPYLYQLGEISQSYWNVANIYDSFVRPCVPLFFMASGFLLLSKNEPVYDFYAKRVNRVIWPLVFWSVIYVFWKVYYQGAQYSDFGNFGKFIFAPVSYHLWYLYAVIGCYLFLPLLRVVVAAGRDSILAYYCAIWFFAMTASPLVDRYFGIKWQFDFSYASGYMGYFVLGYLLGKRECKALHAILAVLSMFVCFSIIAYMTFYLTVKNNYVFVGDFYSYLSPLVVIASASWFVCIKFLAGLPVSESAKNLNRFVISISFCSFGIYLIHVIFVDLCGSALSSLLPMISDFPSTNIPLLSVIVFAASYLAILLIGRVKFMRRVVGA